MEANILPCPHCGKTHDEVDEETKERAVIATSYGEKTFVVQCNWCGMSGPIFETMPDAIAAWNNFKR